MPPDARIHTLLWDLGGVVLSNGWDHDQRAQTAQRFGLDHAELEARHTQQLEAFETGRLSLDDYLARVVFFEARPFTPADFRRFMFSLSRADEPVLALVEELAEHNRFMAAVNNESRELNAHRIDAFGLADLFDAFCSSCYIGVRKPDPEAWVRALGILQVEPEACLYIDDREENLAAPRALGIESVRFESEAQLRQQLVLRGLL